MHSRATDRRSASKCRGKCPDQTLDQAFGLSEVLVAVSTSPLPCKRAGKTRTLMPVWDSSGESRFHSEEPWKGRRLYDLYKATEPSREWFPELLLHARKIGITIFSFVFSPEDVDFLEQFNPPAYKIASADRAFALSSKSRRAKCIT